MGDKSGNWVWKLVTAIFIPVMFFMGNSVIANDKDSRNRDERVTEKLVLVTQEQQKVNQEILVSLAELNGDIKYLIRKENGGRERPRDS